MRWETKLPIDSKRGGLSGCVARCLGLGFGCGVVRVVRLDSAGRVCSGSLLEASSSLGLRSLGIRGLEDLGIMVRRRLGMKSWCYEAVRVTFPDDARLCDWLYQWLRSFRPRLWAGVVLGFEV